MSAAASSGSKAVASAATAALAETTTGLLSPWRAARYFVATHPFSATTPHADRPRTRRLPLSYEASQRVCAGIQGFQPDQVVPYSFGQSADRRAMFALLRRGVEFSRGGTAAVDPVDALTSQIDAQQERKPGNLKDFPEPILLPDDVLKETQIAAEKAISEGLTPGKWAFGVDAKALGVLAEARKTVTIVTDDARTARFFTCMLASAPKSLVAAAPKLKHADVIHARAEDPDAAGAEAGYLAEGAGRVIARGPSVPYVPLLQLLASNVAASLESSGVLLLANADLRRDSKTGVVSLVLGAPTVEASASAGNELQGAHHVFWSPSGVSRVWDGYLSKTSSSVPVESGLFAAKLPEASLRTRLGHPSRVVLALNPSSSKSRAVDAAEALALFEKNVGKFTRHRANPAEAKALLEGLVKAADKKVEFFVYE